MEQHRKRLRRLLLEPAPAEIGNLSTASGNTIEQFDCHIEKDGEEISASTNAPLQLSAWQTKAVGHAEIVAVRSLRGDVQHQLALLKRLGYPEPKVIPAKIFGHLSSLQRAQQEWKSMGRRAEHDHVGAPSGRLADWNNRDPLQIHTLEASMKPLGEVASSGAAIAFTALERSTGTALAPLSESPAKVTAALNDFAQQGPPDLHFLIPSLTVQSQDEKISSSSIAAMPLYAQCCHMILTFGPAPSIDSETVACFPSEVLDTRAKQQEKESSAIGFGEGGVSQDALRRCEKLWEDAERLLESKPKLKLPKFRRLVE